MFFSPRVHSYNSPRFGLTLAALSLAACASGTSGTTRMESAGTLVALNLAHDVITGKRTPADARAFYAKTAMAFKAGDKSSPYVQGLIFQPEPNAADPDKPYSM